MLSKGYWLQCGDNLALVMALQGNEALESGPDMGPGKGGHAFNSAIRGPAERMCTCMLEEKAMVHFLNRFTDYPFLLRWEGREDRIGYGNPVFTVNIKEKIPVKELTDSTSLALGEAYMKGKLDVEGDLYQALDHFLGQMDKFAVNQVKLRGLLHSSNSKKNQKLEVSSHYDIGNDFYKLWLDETLNYSCGYFKTEEDTLYEAQVNKTDYILKKLALEEGMSLLDVGCGWGFLLLRAAREYKVRGTGITLSKEQYQGFKARIEAQGLEDLVTVELMDYRDLEGSGMEFDRVVSVGMVEHVGRENYDRFLKCVNRALKPGGVFLLHFISSQKEHDGDPWIKKYIFPGGVIPSLREIISLMADYNFNILDVENLRNHYNRTLLCWERNFQEHKEEVRAMFDDEFVRMWELYLCSCAATFHNGVIDLHQILVTKGVNNELPMVRWY